MIRPVVSVVMPVFNPDPIYFPMAVDSVLEQTFQDFELIIVEDPSPSSGRDLLWNVRDPRIRHIVNSERTSLVRQHNRALAESRGEFICRADADDINEPDRLEREVAFLRTHPDVDVVASCLTIIDEHSRVIGRRQYPLGHDAIISAMHRFNPIANSSVMYRRELYEKFGGKRDAPLPAQDYEWYSRVARGGARFANLAEPVIRYRVSQMSAAKLRGTIRTTIEVKEMYWRDSMDVPSRAMMALEHALLFLPAWLVKQMFMLVRYRRQ